MHIITPYNPWSPKKKKTWQEELWEQQQIAELEAKILAEAQTSRTLPQNAPPIAQASVGPAVNAAGGAGGAPIPHYSNPQVTAISWSISPSNTGTAPFSVTFYNRSSFDALAFYTWIWNFNDGTAGSTEMHPTHVFSQTGSYRVSLTGSSPQGVVTQSVKIAAVSASRPNLPLDVNFIPTQTTGSVPLIVGFTNLTPNYSATNENTYKWTFSGSNLPTSMSVPITTSAVTNPTITFYQTGSYSVKLETTGSWNCTGSKYILLSVSASHPSLVSSFTAPTVTSYPAGIRFTNASTYTGTGDLQITWSYGTGSLISTYVGTNVLYDAPGVTYSTSSRYTASLQITESSYNLKSYSTRSWFTNP